MQRVARKSRDSNATCKVQYRGCTIHDTGKNHRHFGVPVPLRMGLFLVHISVLWVSLPPYQYHAIIYIIILHVL